MFAPFLVARVHQEGKHCNTYADVLQADRHRMTNANPNTLAQVVSNP